MSAWPKPSCRVYPGVTSALGCVIADMRHDFVLTVNRTLDALDRAWLDSEIARLSGEGGLLLDRSAIPFTRRDVIVELDMSYVGQTHTVAVPIDGTDHAAIRAAFERRYRSVYGRLLDGIAQRVLNLRLSVIGRRPKFDLTVLAPQAAGEPAPTAMRKLYVAGDWVEAPVYARLELPIGTVIPGPAILEQSDTTIFVDPDLEGVVDRFGNLLLRRKAT